jgi:hypothetical protein
VRAIGVPGVSLPGKGGKGLMRGVRLRWLLGVVGALVTSLALVAIALASSSPTVTTGSAYGITKT